MNPKDSSDDESEQIEFKQFNRALPINKIVVSEQNVRKTQTQAGIEELKASISSLGLIHPVIVIPEGDHFSLIVGQRRLNAFKELGRDTIPALIISPMDDTAQKILSFGENIHRRKLPYDDTITVCDALFKKYKGNSLSKVRKIAQDLGISTATVTKYLAFKLIPDEVNALVAANKLPPQIAYRITSAYWPNEKRIVEIAKQATQMTKPEWERTIELAAKKPDATAKEIAELAKKPPTEIDIVVTMSAESVRALEKVAKDRNLDVSGLIKSLVEDWLQEGML